MSVNVAKLRKQAAELEQKRQLDKALEKYIQILDALGDHVDEVDIALYNRVGDLLMRQSSVADAVSYYERAVDLYTEGGFFNNAIALCNKILRNAPGRTSVYYKLGRISAKKGFIADAKQNFLEYADRMQRTGQMEEAFRALTELADLCPDQEDIRLMLADQLAKTDRKTEAIEQLQTLYDKLEAEGREREARATADRMRAIDPDVAPRAAAVTPTKKRGDLVFLEVNYDAAPPAPRLRDGARPAAPNSQDSAEEPAGPKPGDLPLIHPDLDDVAPLPEPASESDALEIISSDLVASELPGLDIGEVEGLESATAADDSSIVEGLERTGIEADGPIESVPIVGLEHSVMDGAAADTEDAGLEISAIDIESIEGVVSPAEVEGAPDAGEPEMPLLDVSEIAGLSPKAQDLELLHPDDGMLMPEMGSEVEEIGTDLEAGGKDGNIPPLSLVFQNDQSALLDQNTDAEPEFAVDDQELEGETVDEPPAEPHDPVKSLIEIDIVDEIVPPSAPPPPAAPRSRTPAFDPELDGLDFIVEAPGPRSSDDVAAQQDADAADSGNKASDDDEASAPLPLIELPVEDPPLAFEPPLPWSPEPEAIPAEAEASNSVPPEPEEELSTLDRLRRSVAETPESGHQRQLLGEALLEEGDRVGGMRALEEAMKLYERQEDFGGARSVVEGLLHLDPNSIRHHQKRVEYAFRSSDRGRLVDAYLGLADCLFRAGQVEKSRAVYIRVSELAPEDRRAREALRSIDPDAATPAGGEVVLEDEAPEPAPSANGSHATEHRESFVNLSSWLTDDAAPKSTRMVADVELPEDDAQVDFRKMLDMFKQGVAANVEDTDHESHYDLGVAYKEMGLLDEAIAEFQKALRGTENRVRTYEALGQCFVEKRQFQIAVTILSRALNDRRYTDEMLVGVLYLLGTAHEALAQPEEARTFYERVVAVDIGFGQAHDRLSKLERSR